MHCTTERMSIGQLYIDQKRIDLDPPYQRETGVWSPEKQALFIDSVINNFDIPKIYIHDLRSRKEPIAFSVIDGKQRLHCIWRFMANNFPLSKDFVYFGEEENPPVKGAYFSDFSDAWKERFRARSLDIVLVQNAEEDDIEELFSRLNNGEALNAAEKRNALGGKINEMIRELSKHTFFTEKCGFSNKRFSYYEVAAKLIKLQKNNDDGAGRICDLKKKHLDDLVVTHKNMAEHDYKKLLSRISDNLDKLTKIFSKKDPSLSKQSHPQLMYIFCLGILNDYGHTKISTLISDFLGKFAAERIRNLELPEDERDFYLGEYGRLAQQGTNDRTSMEFREEILRQFFLRWYPEVEIKDSKRLFTPEERHAIWYLGNKKCANCGTGLPDITHMDADHVDKWSVGGKTTLSNARCLCSSCNRADN
jgi:hypothetical protein